MYKYIVKSICVKIYFVSFHSFSYHHKCRMGFTQFNLQFSWNRSFFFFFRACYSECKTFYAFFLENFIITSLLFSRIQTKNWPKWQDCSTKIKAYKKAVTLLCQCHQARNIRSYQNEIIKNTSSVRAFTIKITLSRDQSN